MLQATHEATERKPPQHPLQVRSVQAAILPVEDGEPTARDDRGKIVHGVRTMRLEILAVERAPVPSSKRPGLEIGHKPQARAARPQHPPRLTDDPTGIFEVFNEPYGIHGVEA